MQTLYTLTDIINFYMRFPKIRPLLPSFFSNPGENFVVLSGSSMSPFVLLVWLKGSGQRGSTHRSLSLSHVLEERLTASPFFFKHEGFPP